MMPVQSCSIEMGVEKLSGQTLWNSLIREKVLLDEIDLQLTVARRI